MYHPCWLELKIQLLKDISINLQLQLRRQINTCYRLYYVCCLLFLKIYLVVVKDARLKKTLKKEIHSLFTDDSLALQFPQESCYLQVSYQFNVRFLLHLHIYLNLWQGGEQEKTMSHHEGSVIRFQSLTSCGKINLISLCLSFFIRRKRITCTTWQSCFEH